MRAVVALLCVGVFHSAVAAQTTDAGRQAFGGRCAGCHGTNGNGGELGPAITSRVPARTDDEMMGVIRQGLPTAGMPAFPNLSDTELRDLVGFLRTLKPRDGAEAVRMKVPLANGSTLD